jgi:arginase family enzyme
MSEIRVVVVPYELGRLRDGVGRGPERLLELGAEDALASAGATVRTEMIELDDRYGASGSGDVGAAFELIRPVSDRARLAREERAFPIVLSGSCFAGSACVSVISARSAQSRRARPAVRQSTATSWIR